MTNEAGKGLSSREERLENDRPFREAVVKLLGQTELTAEELSNKISMDSERVEKFLEGKLLSPNRDGCLRIVEVLKDELDLSFSEQVEIFKLTGYGLGPLGSLDYPQKNELDRITDSIQEGLDNLEGEDLEIFKGAMDRIISGHGERS
jgi:hypothetical protein